MGGSALVTKGVVFESLDRTLITSRFSNESHSTRTALPAHESP